VVESSFSTLGDGESTEMATMTAGPGRLGMDRQLATNHYCPLRGDERGAPPCSHQCAWPPSTHGRH
jgi:hypothetical protein